MPNDIPDWTTSGAAAAPVVLKQAPADSGKYVVNDALAHTYTFTIPAGAKAVRAIFQYGAGTGATNVQLTGDFSATVLGDYIRHAFGVQPNASINDDTRRLVAGDTVLTLQVQLSAGSLEFTLATYTDTADLVVELGGNIGVFDGFPIVTRTSATASPASWQAGTNAASILATNVASGAALVVIPGVANQRVRLARYELYQDGANVAGRWILEDTTAVAFHDLFCTNIRGLLGVGHGDGLPITGTVGAGLQIRNQGAAASFLAGRVTYQQF
jgi:hypothetical protein